MPFSCRADRPATQDRAGIPHGVERRSGCGTVGVSPARASAGRTFADLAAGIAVSRRSGFPCLANAARHGAPKAGWIGILRGKTAGQRRPHPLVKLLCTLLADERRLTAPWVPHPRVRHDGAAVAEGSARRPTAAAPCRSPLRALSALGLPARGKESR